VVNEAMRTKGRAKRTLMEASKKDVLMIHVVEEMTFNRVMHLTPNNWDEGLVTVVAKK